jgi:hypothetical protein
MLVGSRLRAAGLSCLALLACVLGVLRLPAQIGVPARLIAGAIPAIVATVWIGGLLLRRPVVMWMAVGAMASFVVLGIWSVGSFFATAFLVLFAGTLLSGIRTTTVERWLTPVSLLTGATSLCFLIVLRARWRSYRLVTANFTSSEEIDLPAVIEAGAAIFVALATFLLTLLAVRARRATNS